MLADDNGVEVVPNAISARISFHKMNGGSIGDDATSGLHWRLGRKDSVNRTRRLVTILGLPDIAVAILSTIEGAFASASPLAEAT